MSNMRKRISVIMAAAMAMSSMAAIPVHAEDADQVTLTFWSWLPTTDQSEEMIAAFEEQNPNIKIDYTRTEQDDYFEKLQVAMASGTGPDLFGLTTGPMKDQYAPFAEDMNELAGEYWSDWKDVISETAVEQCTTEDGTVAGMPLLVAGMTDLLYNKTLMDECGIEKVPTTYEELKDAAAKAKEAPGRLIPVPRQISAGCGMAWCAPVADRVSLEQLIATEQIVTEGCYELLL